jgi:hypothetical protein
VRVVGAPFLAASIAQPDVGFWGVQVLHQVHDGGQVLTVELAGSQRVAQGGLLESVGANELEHRLPVGRGGEHSRGVARQRLVLEAIVGGGEVLANLRNINDPKLDRRLGGLSGCPPAIPVPVLAGSARWSRSPPPSRCFTKSANAPPHTTRANTPTADLTCAFVIVIFEPSNHCRLGAERELRP